MKYEIAKMIVTGLVSTSTGMVVGNAVKATLPVGANLIKKIGFGIGAVVVGEMVGHKASEYVSEQMDDVTEAWKTMKNFGQHVKETLIDEEETEEGEKTEE
ncbi:hypothetical protein SEA_GOCRAZY_48 [Arthrobacter phage GoCrazy]|nr:hypothetical protein PQB83_gp48 [Arthrobacter phage KeaneyLin]AXH44186.1 hypothetical protein SEA_KEANEYLIN_48 [Arthrobacter phage KeaneyLin]QXO13547.1 hypothetical protein SEA_GOCRAZY_48 [Arthrobacter phage GoCrazy]WBF79094.1 hypothetical protein SEA_HANKLY_48 [Arthrobacter phage Hankly]